MAFEQSTFPGALLFQISDSGVATSSPDLNSAFVFKTSGAVWLARFVSPVGQSSATLTLYAYVTSVTGSPTFELQVRDEATGSEDAQRPSAAGSNLATSPSSLSLTSADNNTWVVFTCTVSLTAGQTYFFIVENTHGTPGSNHAKIQYRGSIDTFGVPLNTIGLMQTGYSADGFATDPTYSNASMGCFVVKFADGSLIGNPYVSTTAHASNANNRGVRVKFSEDVVVSGLVGEFPSSGSATGSRIDTAAGSNIVTHTFGRFEKANYLGRISRFAPVTLAGGVSHDIVITYSSVNGAGPFYTMGEAEGSVPADVLACRPQGLASVDGATPGSYTVDNSQIMRFGLIIDDNPAIAGGGGGVVVPSGMRGGFVN